MGKNPPNCKKPMISIILSGEGHRDRGSPGGCGHQNDNGWWHGCRDKICFRCLFAEGSGKPTSPYPTLISYAPGVLHAHRQRWYETTPVGGANEKRVPRRAWNLTGTSGYARMIDAARLIESQILGRAYFLCRLIASLAAASAFSRSESNTCRFPRD